MSRVLLLNPPGRLRYIRDQFCSHVSKGSCYWQPLDPLVLSGQLGAAVWDVAVVDAMAEQLARHAALGRIGTFAPDGVVFLTGHDSFAEDLECVELLRAGGVATLSLDSSWSAPAFSTEMLPATRLARFQLRAIERSCVRPSYLARRAMQIGSWTEFHNEVGNAAALAWQPIARQRRASRTRLSS